MSRGQNWEALLKSYPDSVKINAVSEGAEVLYVRLIAACDSLGHYWGDPAMIACKLFTHRCARRQLTPQVVKKRLLELVGVGLVALYEVGGVSYVELVDLYRKRRADFQPKSIFPQVVTTTGTMPEQCRNNNGEPLECDRSISVRVSVPKTKTKTKTKTLQRELDRSSERTTQPPSADKDEIVLSFPTNGGHGDWHLKQSKVNQYKASYPDLDVLANLRLARQWVVDNHKKTFRGMPAYLNRWLNRAQDQLREPTRFGQPQPEQKCRPLTREEMLAPDD
jgi:hypothetical protein